MMTVVAVGPACPLHDKLSFITVVIFAAHHMIIVIQRRRFPEREN
jgi:hypothetical protein